MWINNIIALIVTFAVALAWLRLNDFFATRGWVSSRTSRKFIHIGTGPLFVLCWLLFNDAASSRFLAALVPFSITIQFALVGLGMMKDESTVQGMSRSGDRREILRGPLYYGIVFVILTILFWKENPVGIVALMMICGGDGLAEILGRKYGDPQAALEQNQVLGGQYSVSCSAPGCWRSGAGSVHPGGRVRRPDHGLPAADHDHLAGIHSG